MFLAGFFGEGPFGLEPGFFGLFDQEADFYGFSGQRQPTQADGRDRHSGAAQGTDSTTTIHTVDSLLLFSFFCRSELAREKPESAACIQDARVIVNVFREQARSYRGKAVKRYSV
jgi:hypothetical protein